MALIDDIERLGRAVETDGLDRATAIRELIDSSNGGLTEQGAADLIDTWRTARAQYVTVQENARAGLTGALNEAWRQS